MGEWEVINLVSVLWICNKNEVIEEQYIEFYKNFSYDFVVLLVWVYNWVEGSIEYMQLLYVLSKVVVNIFICEVKVGIKFYVKCVFIMDDVDNLILNYLCFV